MENIYRDINVSKYYYWTIVRAWGT